MPLGLTRVLGLAVVSAVMITSCGSQDSSPSQAKVIGGIEATAQTEVTSYTVSLMYGSNRVYCSGSLAEDKRLVVTAGHCLDRVNNINRLKVGFGNNMNASNRIIIPAKSYKVHDDYFRKTLPNGGDILKNDIAIIHLKQNAPDGFEPIRILPSSDSLQSDTRLKISGFGKTDMPGSQEDRIDGKLRHYDAKVTRVFRNTKEFDQRTVTDDSNTCQGDSGGAAVIGRGNIKFLVGANSRAPKGCRSGRGTFTDVNQHYGFIQQEYGILSGIDIADLGDDNPSDDTAGDDSANNNNSADAFVVSPPITTPAPDENDSNSTDTGFIYKVARGDSIPKIARKCNISEEKLLELNPRLQGQGVLYVGLKLSVPGTCRTA